MIIQCHYGSQATHAFLGMLPLYYISIVDPALCNLAGNLHLHLRFYQLYPVRFSNPWINRNIKRLARRKKRAHKKAKTSKKTKDWSRYKHLQKVTQQEVRKAHDKYMDEIISGDITNNPKRLWTYLKSQKQDTAGVAPLKDGNGLLRSDAETKAELLNNQFQSAYTREELSRVPDKGLSPHPPMKDIRIDNHGVHKLLRGLKPHKATGPDMVPARFLRDYAMELSNIISKLFQFSIDSGTIPNDWKTASIVPIFKKGEKHKPANYRPVSLTSICCKLLEHIVHSNIMDHYDQLNILTDKQHGFRSKRSCETQLIVTIQELAKSMSVGEQVDIVLLDFSKAFDKVPHRRLLHKLNYYGVRGHTINWIESFLSYRTQQVIIEGKTSTTADVLSGVPQGTVLGPLLFLTFINDMPDCTRSDIRLFADDSLLYRRIRSRQDTTILQEDLAALEKWERDWQMSFNPEKCTVIHVTNKRSPVVTPYRLHGHTLERERTSKYLGVTISQDLKWNTHISNITSKANKSLGFIRRNMRGCKPSAKDMAYKAIVRPTLEYAATVWDPHTTQHINSIEMVQRRAARFVENNYHDYSPGTITNILEHRQWETLQARRSKARLTMMFKILHGDVVIPSDSYVSAGDSRTRGAHRLREIPSPKDVYKYSFFPRTVRQWNHLPAEVATATTVDGFKVMLGRLPADHRALF